MDFSFISTLGIAQLVYAVIVIFVASVLRGLTGFGFSALIVTGLSFVFLPTQVVVLALILEIIASVHLLPSVWRQINWSLFLSLLVGVVVATPVGMFLLNWAHPDIMRLIISIIVFVFALIIGSGYSMKKEGSPFLHTGIGVVSGLCNGAAALGGLPIVAFMLSGKSSVASIRATLVAMFFATDIYAMFFAGSHGIVGEESLTLALLALPILFVGVSVGKQLYNRASPELFKKVALALLLFISFAGGVKSIIHLL